MACRSSGHSATRQQHTIGGADVNSLHSEQTTSQQPICLREVSMCHTDVLPLELRRKLAVWAATGGWLGIGRYPSAMPTMAVM